MKRIISLFIILIMTIGMGVFAEANNTEEITVMGVNSTEEVILTKLTDEEVQAILNDPNTVTEKANSPRRAIGFTGASISVTKNGSTATVLISSSASNICSQIGFKDGYIQNAGSIGSDYRTNTSSYSGGYSFTMKDGVTYQASVTHHCFINGDEYKQSQTGSSFTK